MNDIALAIEEARRELANAAAEFLPDACSVRRVSKVKGSDLGNTNSETVLASGVPCRVKPSSTQERQVAGASEGSIAFTVRVPYWHGNVNMSVIDSTCYLDIKPRTSTGVIQSLAVIGPLPGSMNTMLDVVAIRQA